MNRTIENLAVVIVTFNRIEELKKTITAVYNQGIDYTNIYVINNNSKDATKETLEIHYPAINAIHLQNNIASAGGFAKGMEVAYEHGFDWIWLFNDDSRPVKGTLESFIHYLQKQAQVFIAFNIKKNFNTNMISIIRSKKQVTFFIK